MPDLGRTLIVLGLVLLGIGAFVLLVSRLGVPLGRLPGDINLRGRTVTFSFPIVSCLLLSALLSLAFYLLNRFRH